MVKNTMCIGKLKIELTSTPFSTMTKSRPWRLAAIAVARPDGPAPTMMTSRTAMAQTGRLPDEALARSVGKWCTATAGGRIRLHTSEMSSRRSLHETP